MKKLFYLLAAATLAFQAHGAGTIPRNGAGGTNAVDITSDDFNSMSLDAGVWRFVNPLDDASFELNGAQLAITVPEGISHDITAEGNFAPCMFQNVYNPQDFEIVVKFDGLMRENYQMQGLQFVQDSLNFLRLEFFSEGPATNRLAWSFVNGVVDSIAIHPILPVTAPLYMKIRRVADTWTQHWSTDGINYTFGVTFNRVMNVTRIGVYGSNAGHPRPSAPAFTGLIDYFQAMKPAPVTLPRFTATNAGGEAVQLEWSATGSENLRGFEVQRSYKGQVGFTTLPGSFVESQGVPFDYVWYDQSAGDYRWYYRLKLIRNDGTVDFTDPIPVDGLTSVAEVAPSGYELHQNFPNPFNPETKIRFSVEKSGPATLRVFNLIGQEVASLFNDVAESGKLYSVQFNGAALTSGIYFYSLESAGRTAVRKLTLVK